MTDIESGDWWTAIGDRASTPVVDQQRIRASAESLYAQTGARGGDVWSDGAVQFMEQCLIQSAAGSPSALTDGVKDQFGFYIGSALAELSGGHFVELPTQLQDSGLLAVFIPGENSLVPIANLVESALAQGSADMWCRELDVVRTTA